MKIIAIEQIVAKLVQKVETTTIAIFRPEASIHVDCELFAQFRLRSPFVLMLVVVKGPLAESHVHATKMARWSLLVSFEYARISFQ